MGYQFTVEVPVGCGQLYLVERSSPTIMSSMAAVGVADQSSMSNNHHQSRLSTGIRVTDTN